MPPTKPIRASYFLVGLTLFSGVVGWNIPAFYDWTGADQSRPVAILWQVPLGIFIATLVSCCALPWISVSRWDEANSIERLEPEKRFQFSLKSILVWTTISAVAAALLTVSPTASAGCVYAVSLGTAIFTAYRHRERRLAIATIFACLLLPFAWTFTEGMMLSLNLFWFVSATPSLVLMAIVARVFDANIHNIGWVAILFTGAEITMGLWLIRGGPKRTIAYLAILTISSLYSSLMLNALLRA